MKKLFLILILLFCFSLCFSDQIPIPVVTGKGNIRTDGLPQGATPPSTIFKTSNITGAVPTNKWFNSILYGCYNSNPSNINKYSFKMYTFPQVVKCDDNGSKQNESLLIGFPVVSYSKHLRYYDLVTFRTVEELNIEKDPYLNSMKVTAYKNFTGSEEKKMEGTNPLLSGNVKLDNYGDWSATAIWEDSVESTKYMKATFGQGFVFTYFEFEKTLYPAIEFPYNWTADQSNRKFYWYKADGTLLTNNDTVYQSDRIILKVSLPNKNIFYGIFIPENSEFRQNIDHAWQKVTVKTPEGNERYIAVALLPSKDENEAVTDLAEYYKYAYNFVDNTEASFDIVKSNDDSIINSLTNFSFSFKVKREGNDFIKKETLFCLLPHQYDNIASSLNPYGTKNFPKTLRGDLKIFSGAKFSTEVKFNGIVPFLQHSMDDNAKAIITSSLSEDLKLSIDPKDSNKNTYYYGKNLAKMANLIPIADNIYGITGSTTSYLINKVKDELIRWFTYNDEDSSQSKYFAFDKTWGGLIGIMNGFGSQNYNDHNFHYGYFIYASAIVAMYDADFAQNYGGIVKLLIEDIANDDRENKSFPYMRSFDFYESHSWANGMGGSSDEGIDIESSSEAMNAWAAIYMWGLATKNPKYINLGICLYSNEYEAIKNYFFDIDNKILKSVVDEYGQPKYNHVSIGILYGGLMQYGLHWAWENYAREIKGIQLLPMTASMLYLGYDKKYAEEKFYKEMELETATQTEHNENHKYWNDIWSRFRSLYNPEQAWKDFKDNHDDSMIDDGGTATYTYHFIDFFKQNGTLQTEYSANIPSFLVTNKNDTPIFSAYNYTDTVQNVRFYDNSGYLGYMKIFPKSFMSTSKLLNEKTQTELLIFPIPYKPNSGTKYDGDGITFLGLPDGSNIKIFNVAGELVYDKTIENANKNFIWDVRNNSGNKIASGVYIYYITSSDGTKHKGKLAIER